MSELDYEEPPAPVYVPRVRNWWTPLRYGLGRALLRWPRHVWVPLWFLPIMWLLALFLAAALWAFCLALLIPYGIWAIAECVTYRKRQELAQVQGWAEWVEGQHPEDPPA